MSDGVRSDGAGARSARSPDRIRTVQVHRVAPRWLFVQVTTVAGHIGWGEAIVPKRAAAVEGAVHDLARNLVDADPARIEELRWRMRNGGFFRGGPILATAAAAIEHALWDIAGRSVERPVHALFGGPVRDRVRTYAWVGGDRPHGLVEDIQRRLDQGYSMVKLNGTDEFDQIASTAAIDDVVSRVGAIRDTYGNRIDFAIDFHGRVHRAMARSLVRELEVFRPTWIEEPLPPGNEATYRDLFGTDRRVPIATGERFTTLAEFLPLLEHRVVDVLQPDVSLTGIAELVQIARVAEAYDVAVAPHCPNGPLSLAATLQVGATCLAVAVQEQSLGMHYHQGYDGLPAGEMFDYLRDPAPLTPADGFLQVPDGSGLGIDIDDSAVLGSESWELADPTWRLPDGRVTEW